MNRSRFQGVLNVLRFNWHFYVIATVAMIILLLISHASGPGWGMVLQGLSIVIILTTLVSLGVTYYVYDVSDLFNLGWLDEFAQNNPSKKILNINAGFDETSLLIGQKFKSSELHIADFYDPNDHTEISIKRARKLYPPHPKTVAVQTRVLPYADHEFDMVCVTFAAHEIRNVEERLQFFKELGRVTLPGGVICVTEHLRDFSNFMAYTIGFLHFYSRRSWLSVFQSSGLNLFREIKTTPFISTFILSKHGTTH